ncbi:MAG: hypothetical protein J7647_27220 [Cyanobacteria bacterium SBLK]|nr:hypothetical protein [Cyanobacteria bacterium SBLK]
MKKTTKFFLKYIKTNLLKNIDFYLFLGIILIVFWVYSPSLYHAPRADQIMYLHDVNDIDGLKSLTLDKYALDRDRGADALLFRPMLFFLLGLEKWMFGYQFEYWQLMGIILHLMVLFVFFNLLKFQAQPLNQAKNNVWISLWAFGITLLFGIQSISMEMVVWHHINAYILFAFFTLTGILCVQHFISSQNYIFLSISFIVILLSAFTYELGSIVSLLLAIYLFNFSRRKTIVRFKFVNYLPFVAIPIIYFSLSLFDLYNRGYNSIPFPNIMEVSTIDGEILVNQNWLLSISDKLILQPCLHFFIYILVWFFGGLIPGLYELQAGGRISLLISSDFVPGFSKTSLSLTIGITIAIIEWMRYTRKKGGQKNK